MASTNYAFLSGITDLQTRQAVKTILDRLAILETGTATIGTITKPLAAKLDAAGQAVTNLPVPKHATDAVTLDYLTRYVEQRLQVTVVKPVTIPPVPPPPAPPSGLVCYTNRAIGQPGGIPAAPNTRWFRGDFCGVTVPGLPAVAGGAADPSVVFSPFIDRYAPADQAKIIAAHLANGYTHFKVSWPNSRVSGGVGSVGQSIGQFVATCQMLKANGLYPVTFLLGKEIDPANPAPNAADAVIAALQAGGVADIMCVGWELNLFNDPGAPLQGIIDHIAGLVVPATNLYVHFSEGYVAWQAPGDLGSAFWIANINKLTGILHQKVLTQDCGLYQARLADLLVRFGDGVGGWPTNNGFGHAFDVVADEYSASFRFDGSMTEATAQIIGNQAISSPNQTAGPPTIPVMGFNNGGPHV